MGVAGAQSQSYPTRPITLIVPFPAGGPTDTIARIIGDHMKDTLGQTVIIENVTGAGSTIGTGRAVAAPPDGYTLYRRQLDQRTSARARSTTRRGTSSTI